MCSVGEALTNEITPGEAGKCLNQCFQIFVRAESPDVDHHPSTRLYAGRFQFRRKPRARYAPENRVAGFSDYENTFRRRPERFHNRPARVFGYRDQSVRLS